MNNSTTLSVPYEKRPIRFLELWEHDKWRIKIYGIAYGRATPRAQLIGAAKHVATQRLASVPDFMRHYSVGFLGIHEGRSANFVFVDWWADENELHHHVYVSPTEEPGRFTYVTPTGLVACVWDLRVMAFEREAWVHNILQRSDQPDFDGYLGQRLEEDV
jgi:hypothetical protein